MSTSEQRRFLFAPTALVAANGHWFGLEVHHREFLDALADEWLVPASGSGGRILGISSFAKKCHESTQTSSNPILVRLCFDRRLLPNLTVPIRTNGTWRECALDAIPSDAQAILWPGSIPVFALSRISVNSTEERARLMGLTKQVSNLSMPNLEIEVNEQKANVDSTDLPSSHLKGVTITAEYGRIRGATSMAVWAIPRVDPWFDILLASLKNDHERLRATTANVGIPWYANSPWLSRPDVVASDSFDCKLWMAALRFMQECQKDNGIDSAVAIDQIYKFTAKDAKVDIWRKQTHSMLRGEEAFQVSDWKQSTVGKALQVLLLRPQPETFSKWLQDLPGIPPPVWFSAATLFGYLNGYRSLPSIFRGDVIQRRTLATHALAITSDNTQPINWPFPGASELTWYRDDNEFVIKCGEAEFARKGLHPRTLWYIADLEEPVVQNAAGQLSRRLGWDCFKRKLTLSDSSIPFVGNLSIEDRTLHLHGSVTFEFAEPASISESLDRELFNKCLTVEGAPSIQPPPVEKRAFNGKCHAHPTIHGLLFIEDYITASEEKDLIAEIDAGVWLEVLKRRVQHFGWKYDYKARQVKPEMYLGPLPVWATKLADRLTRDNLVPHRPDQVIVNEYTGKQGITKHVDCKPCFEDGIAMISLLESWEMIFSQGRDSREIVLLPRRSVAVLTGEARYLWTHEIPKRMVEPGGLRRQRRISITLRKVISNKDTSTSKPRSGHRTNRKSRST